MTPDQIRRQKMLESITPKDNSANVIGDAVAAGAPGLLAFLGGASPSVTTGLFEKGNQYAASRGKQETDALSKLEVVEDESGEPVNVLQRDAVGQRPYFKPSAGQGAPGGNVQSARSYSNKKTGEIADFYLARNGLMYRVGENEATGTPIDPMTIAQDYVPFKGFATANVTDAYGNQTVTQAQRTLPSKKDVIASTRGYGSMVGVPTEGVKQTEKSLDEHNKRIGDLEMKKNDMQSSLSILENPNANPTELTAARESLIRSITTEPRLTDEDVQRAMGTDFRSVFSQLRNMASSKGFGQMNPLQRKEFLTAAKTLIAKMDKGIQKSYEKMLSETATVPGGKKYIEEKTKPQTKKSKKSKADFESIKQVAKKSFGNDKKMYDSYIKKKALEMGIDDE